MYTLSMLCDRGQDYTIPRGSDHLPLKHADHEIRHLNCLSASIWLRFGQIDISAQNRSPCAVGGTVYDLAMSCAPHSFLQSQKPRHHFHSNYAASLENFEQNSELHSKSIRQIEPNHESKSIGIPPQSVWEPELLTACLTWTYRIRPPLPLCLLIAERAVKLLISLL